VRFFVPAWKVWASLDRSAGESRAEEGEAAGSPACPEAGSFAMVGRVGLLKGGKWYELGWLR